MMITGAGLMLLGVILPFMMVLQVIESTFFLNFFSHACSVLGIFLAFYGLFTHIRIERK